MLVRQSLPVKVGGSWPE